MSLNRSIAAQSISMLLLAIATVLALPAPIHATETTPATIQAGSIFEVLADLPAPGNAVSWVLTKADGTFIQADRNQIFRERFAEIGDYRLSGEVIGADKTVISSLVLPIRVSPTLVTGQENAPAIGTLVKTTPADTGDGTVKLAEGQTVVLITPSKPQIALDLDAMRDRNRDGDPANDAETTGTYFQSDGSALYVWFVDAAGERRITASSGDQRQTITISFGTPPREASSASMQSSASVTTSPPVTGTTIGNIVVEDRGNGAIAFTLDTQTTSLKGRAILLLWDFGDGRQSMLDRPVHSFATNGSFLIHVRARDLMTGAEVLDTQGMVNVVSVVAGGSASSIAQTTSSAGAVSSVAQSSASSTSDTSGSSWMTKTIGGISVKTILIGGVILVIALVIGIMLVTILGRLVRHALEKKDTTAKPSTMTHVVGNEAPPMSVMDVSAFPVSHTDDFPTRPEVPSDESGTKPNKTPMPDTPPLNQLTFNESEAPSWLRSGHEEAEKVGQTPLTPPPATLTPLVPESAVPSWLSSAPSEPSSAAQESSPVAVEPATPPSTITPAPAPLDEIPDWLNPQGAKSMDDAPAVEPTKEDTSMAPTNTPPDEATETNTAAESANDDPLGTGALATETPPASPSTDTLVSGDIATPTVAQETVTEGANTATSDPFGAVPPDAPPLSEFLPSPEESSATSAKEETPSVTEASAEETIAATRDVTTETTPVDTLTTETITENAPSPETTPEATVPTEQPVEPVLEVAEEAPMPPDESAKNETAVTPTTNEAPAMPEESAPVAPVSMTQTAPESASTPSPSNAQPDNDETIAIVRADSL